MKANYRGLPLVALCAFVLAGCGGGGGSDEPGAPAPTYSISVSVSGLAGSGLSLRNNGGDALAVSTNGSTTFSTALPGGASYAVTVGVQPSSPSQTCTVNNGTGTISGSNVANVSISCVTNSFSVGGTVSGLSGSGLVLINSGGDDLTVASNGSFIFNTPVLSGQTYDVRVLTSPAAPNQRCTVGDATGAVGNAAVTTIAIDCVTEVPRVGYSVDYNSASVSIYGIDADTGQLRPRGHARTGLNPIMAMADQAQRFWFVLNRGDATLSAFLRDDVTGALSEVGGSPYATGGIAGGDGVGPSCLAVHPSGRFVYVVNTTGYAKIAAFAIDQVTGTLTPAPGSPFAAGTNPFWLSIDAKGTFAYVTHRGSNDIYTYSIDATTGSLTEVANSRVTTGASPRILLVHGNGRFAYVPNVDDGTISAFTIEPGSGVLTAVAGGPVAAGVNPSNSAFIHPSGRFLYLRNAGAVDGNGSISAYAIDVTTGALAANGGAVAIGANSTRATIDPSGKFIFVANRGAPLGGAAVGSISAFSVDPATGSLTALAGVSNLQPGPHSVSVDPSSRYLYGTNAATNTHWSYALNSTTGDLTPLAHSAVIVGRDQPISLTVYGSVASPAPARFRSKFAAVPNSTDATISAYSVHETSGALTAANPVAAAGATPLAAAFHPSGRFLLAGSESVSAGLASHPVDSASGALSAFDSGVPLGAGATAVLASPHGRNAYVLTPSMSRIQAFGVNPASGALAAISGFNAINTHNVAATAMAIAPNGRFMHFITDDGWGLDEFNHATGGPTGTGGTTGLAPGRTALAIDPNGRYAYVAVTGTPSGTIERWSINVQNGLLQSIGSVATGAAPKSIAIDPTGRFLYVANSGSNDVSTFSIAQANGALTELLPRIAAGTNPVSVAVDYSGKFLYALSRDTSAVLAYSIGADGSLTPLGTVATGVGASQIVLSSDME